VVAILAMAAVAHAQEWSSWVNIQFFGGEDDCTLGRSNCSYCEQESLLYFLALSYPDEGCNIRPL
jgi:hypothetical protein